MTLPPRDDEQAAAEAPQFIVDELGRIVGANEALGRLLGLSDAALSGRPVAQLVAPDAQPRLAALLARFGGSGQWLVGALSLRHADGSTVDFPCQGRVQQRPLPGGGRLVVIEMNRQPGFPLLNRKIDELQAEIRRRQESEQKFATAFSSCPIAASIATAAEGRIIEANANYERDFGWTRDDLIGRTATEVGLWPSVAARDAWIDVLRRDGYIVDHETEWMHKNGQRCQVSISGELIELGGVQMVLAYIIDISARKAAEAELRVAAAAFESNAGMMITDAQRVILRVNRAFTQITGFSADEVIGRSPVMFKSDRHDEAFYRQMAETVARTGTWQGEVWDLHKDGRAHPKWLTIAAVRDEHGAVTHYVETQYDITERKLAEERINELAFYDQLTQLPNRTLLLDRLRQSMSASGRTHTQGALLLIDLDDFKSLNDTLGHDMGDLLLRQVAQRLASCVRACDTVARLGGDEFVVMLVNLSSATSEAGRQAEHVAEKIIATLNEPYQLNDVLYHSTPSIGITLFGARVAEIEAVLKQADLAMYRAKASGRNALCFFDPDMETAVMKRTALERDLRGALQGGQLSLHYQPQLASGQLLGAEALLRWEHPRRGMISPAEFIPLAEETGLIIPLGHWVMQTACAQLAAWAADPALSRLSIAVNVSVKQFLQADFVERLLDTVAATRANPQRLKLELTESLLVSNVEAVVEKMFALRAKGVGFALDDFGTGYSSLSYLKRLPLDQLKIDQSFVRDLLVDPNDAAIVRTITALAQNLGLGVIAEGVETQAQLDFLAHVGCHAYQGYLFSRPQPIALFERFVREHLGGQPD